MSGNSGSQKVSDGYSGEPRRYDFSAEEYEGRRSRLYEEMARSRLDAVLINSKPNHRYFTGHWTGRWNNMTRPLFLILIPGHAPVIVCNEVEEGMAIQTSYGSEVRTYGGSGGDLTAPLWRLIDIFHELGVSTGRIGAELGLYLRPQVPPMMFDQLRAGMAGSQLVDASNALWALRVHKSSAEVEYLREAARITDTMFETVPSWIGEARTDRDVYFHVAKDLLAAGADSVGYVNVHPDVSGPAAAGYTGRPIRDGSAVYIDAGCLVRGYWSDFCRMFAVGRVPEPVRDGYRRLWDLTQTCLDAIRPGVTFKHVCEAVYSRSKALTGGQVTPFLGRVGHGLGLDMPEPPSIWMEERRTIEPGMVLCVEPSLLLPEVGLYIGEETISVTTSGFDYLTMRAPEELRNPQ